MASIPYSCQILMKTEFFRQIFQKYLNVKFNENLYSGNSVVSCGRKDRRIDTHDEANSRFLHLCTRA
jgi:hypothetical protein